MSAFSSINPTELSVFANIAAITLANDRTPEDNNVLGNFIVAIGGLVLTIAAQQQFLISEQDKLKEIKDLKSQLKQKQTDLDDFIR